MIRYRYTRQLNPPAPFVLVRLRCPATQSNLSDLPAQVDTAADRTVLPGRLIRELGLADDGRARFQGFAGEVVELPIYLVEIQIHDFKPNIVRAALGENESNIPLGRDVLNSHHILLDGPGFVLEIGPQKPQ